MMYGRFRVQKCDREDWERISRGRSMVKAIYCVYGSINQEKTISAWLPYLSQPYGYYDKDVDICIEREIIQKGGDLESIAIGTIKRLKKYFVIMDVNRDNNTILVGNKRSVLYLSPDGQYCIIHIKYSCIYLHHRIRMINLNYGDRKELADERIGEKIVRFGDMVL